jgi:hypothetical protein
MNALPGLQFQPSLPIELACYITFQMSFTLWNKYTSEVSGTFDFLVSETDDDKP